MRKILFASVSTVIVLGCSLGFIACCTTSASSGNDTAAEASCKIYLRHDQNSRDVGSHPNPQVAIYAPSWLREGLALLGSRLQGTTFSILERYGADPLGTLRLSNPILSLSELQKIARNEDINMSGEIHVELYTSGGVVDWALILALKDLVRQCIVVGKDVATHYNGYPELSRRRKLHHPTPVYVGDLAALQFQKPYNTGRLVLINEGPPTATGLLDSFIYENVVGERKKLYEEAVRFTEPGRYIPVHGFWNVPTLLDVVAYQRFVAHDVVLAGLAFSDSASRNGDKLNFKFLKYGTGFFSGWLRWELNAYILEGVVQGLETLFNNYTDKVKGTIRHVELTFYNNQTVGIGVIDRLKRLREKYWVGYSFSSDSAMKPTKWGLITASTNCGDTLVVMGNEMGFGSVDATIAENIQSKGNIFCPILNPEIQERFLDVSSVQAAEQCTEKEDGSAAA